jgi:hypothetical protein
MIAGCFISLISFCLLPYLVGTEPSFAFTGLQLVTLGSPILLPPDSKVYNFPPQPPPELQLVNIPFIWVLLLLVVLLLLAAVGDMLLTLTDESVRRGITRGILIAASLAFCFSLCSFGYNAVLNGFTLIGRLPVIRGSLFSPGFLGLLVGLLIAFIGAMMTLRTKRSHPKMPKR